jgi:hypothetical protein
MAVESYFWHGVVEVWQTIVTNPRPLELGNQSIDAMRGRFCRQVAFLRSLQKGLVLMTTLTIGSAFRLFFNVRLFAFTFGGGLESCGGSTHGSTSNCSF